MKSTFLVFCATFLALAFTGLAYDSDPAAAQQAAEVVEEIVVIEAPIERRRVGRSAIGAPIEIIELRRRVSFADLDLSKHADVTELETRIDNTAKESCEQLSDMFRTDLPSKEDVRRCTDQAVDGTKEQLQAAIAAASK